MARNRKGKKINGWVLLDKPLGLTSTQALGKVRFLLGAQKAGHGGTLDPLASGVLPIALGEATKLIPFVMDGQKEYYFTIRWGEARTTEDAEGEITATSAVRPDAAAIEAVLPRFIGSINQMPPIFSALKVDGQRAYDLARAGEVVNLTARTVQIFDCKLISTPDADHATLVVACGKGTYVRSLARDIALALGTVGHVSALRRSRVGCFALEQTISLEKLAELAHKGDALTALHAMTLALDDIPARIVDMQEAHRLRHGQSILAAPSEVLHSMMLATEAGQPIAIIAYQDGVWQPVRGFNL
jgi:tRNA pseudouridine55 synthase